VTPADFGTAYALEMAQQAEADARRKNARMNALYQELPDEVIGSAEKEADKVTPKGVVSLEA
jgi:hypothetical protein